MDFNIRRGRSKDPPSRIFDPEIEETPHLRSSEPKIGSKIAIGPLAGSPKNQSSLLPPRRWKATLLSRSLEARFAPQRRSATQSSAPKIENGGGPLIFGMEERRWGGIFERRGFFEDARKFEKLAFFEEHSIFEEPNAHLRRTLYLRRNHPSSKNPISS